MDWWLIILVIGITLMFLFATGMPVAFCFLLIDFVAVFLLWGFSGPEQLILSIGQSVSRYSLMPIPLFILMGTVLSHSGIATRMIDAVDKWFGRLPGRLCLLAIASGTVLATLTGASAASTAILGKTLLPMMVNRGYKPNMSMGSIMAGGGLAPLIPPSGMAILIGAIGQIDIGQILVAMIIPGLIMAIVYCGYYVVRAYIQPNLAPPYDSPPVPTKEKINSFARYILPTGLIIFLVIGVIFLGVATPTEAAATGALGTFILVASYGALSVKMGKNAIVDALRTGGMMLMVMAGATAFAEILAYTGASSGLVKYALGLPVHPMVLFAVMQIIIVILGVPLNPGPIVMLTLPLFMPIVQTLGFSEIWFAIVLLINLELSQVSPPVGMGLFVMKGVSKYPMREVFAASIPVCLLNLFGMVLITAFPITALWLPNLMY